MKTPKASGRFFADHIDQGNLPPDFNRNSAVSLLRDLSAAMIVQARDGAPLDKLAALAPRNTELVLHIGKDPSETTGHVA